MKVEIWKYKIPAHTYTEIEMPKGAKVLTVQTQRGEPCIWAIVDPNQEKEIRCFFIYGTGISFDYLQTYKYIGTFQPHDYLVFHLFEVTKP